jgi:glycosyltransferase involved in cell wall biosynthesis
VRIPQVIPFFAPKFGGSVTVPYQLSRSLSENGHNVTILTSDFEFDKKFAQEIERYGVIVIPFHTIINFGLFIYSPSMKTWLDKNIMNFDVVHLHNFRSYQNSIVSGSAVKNGIPYILQAHGSVLPFFEKQNLKKLYDTVWGYQILKDASGLIAVSKAEKGQYLKMGLPESKIEIVPNGIDISEYETLPERGEFRRKYNIGSNEKIILYLGRLHKSKNLDYLINSVSSLLNQQKGVRLVIAGPDDGVLDALIKQIKQMRIDNEVLFTGPLYKKEKLKAYVDADVLVYPGVIEIFGLVPFESIMCGTPIIVSDDCGCGEIVAAAQCGYLVQFGNVHALKEQIQHVFNNTEEATALVLKGQDYIKRNLTNNSILGKVLEVYARVR